MMWRSLFLDIQISSVRWQRGKGSHRSQLVLLLDTNISLDGSFNAHPRTYEFEKRTTEAGVINIKLVEREESKERDLAYVTSMSMVIFLS